MLGPGTAAPRRLVVEMTDAEFDALTTAAEQAQQGWRSAGVHPSTRSALRRSQEALRAAWADADGVYSRGSGTSR